MSLGMPLMPGIPVLESEEGEIITSATICNSYVRELARPLFSLILLVVPSVLCL